MNDVDDHEDFIIEFKSQKALSVLKKYIIAYENDDEKSLDKLEEMAQVALLVCQRKLQDIDEIIDDHKKLSITQKVITDKEWEILGSDELNEQTLAQKKHDDYMKSIDKKYKAKKKKKKKKKQKNVEKTNEQDEDLDESEDDDQETELVKNIRTCLLQLKEKFPQFDINQTKNIWILKPAGLSRGRGITVLNNLIEIVDHVKSKESTWVIQKYIENTLVIKKRKFDIRQWVLVTDWNPLTIWFYGECYIRFGADLYDPNDMGNLFSHLTNNSIGKNRIYTGDEEIIDGNMWNQEEFIAYLTELDKERDIFKDIIQLKMKEIVKYSLECVQDMIENRKNSVELFGYDFMVDENFNVWLIEINSSPAMDYSTSVTKRLVKMVMRDTAKVIVDYGMSKKRNKSKIDTGEFQLIYKGETFVERPSNNMALNFVCEGIKIDKKK